MSVAPQPYLSACVEVLFQASTTCRVWGWDGKVSAEHLADLMDAIHNIPYHIQNWERCDVEVLRKTFLMRYQEKWTGRGGLPLCDIFDHIVASGVDVH